MRGSHAQNGDVRRSHHALGDGAHEGVRDTLSTVGAEDDEIDAERYGNRTDLVGRIALTKMPLHRDATRSDPLETSASEAAWQATWTRKRT